MLSIYLPIAGIHVSLLLLVGLGFTVGVLAGFFGMGGGWIVTPALNTFGFPMPFAIGTGLANIAGQSMLAVTKHRKMGSVSHRVGVVLGLSMVAGVEGGARTVLYLASLGAADEVIRWVYIVFLSALGVAMLVEYLRGRRAGGKQNVGEAKRTSFGLLDRWRMLRIPPMVPVRRSSVRVSLWVLMCAGLAIGFLAGIMGAGGGFALVPFLVYVVGAPTYVAVGTSLICVAISGTYGAFTYALKGQVELFAALWMMAGAAVGAQLGSMAIRHVHGAGVRLLYAIMLLLASAGVVMKQFGLDIPAAACILGGGAAMCVIIVGLMVRGAAGKA